MIEHKTRVFVVDSGGTYLADESDSATQ